MSKLSRRSIVADSRVWQLLLLAGGVIVRIVLIRLHPIVYGGDSVMRMMNADRIQIAYQLPFLQVLIFAANLLSEDPVTLRYLMAVVGGLAGISFFWLSSRLWGREVGLLSGLFFISNPFLLVHSLVPYQEILMLLLLSAGLASLFEADSGRHLLMASLFLGLACLTRYEAWIVTGIAGAFFWWQGRRGSGLALARSFLRTVILFGWAPMIWLGVHRGLSPPGTWVIEWVPDWARLCRIPQVLAMTAFHAGLPVLILSFWGGLEVWRKSLWRSPRIQMLIVATVALLVGLVFSAHGVPPDPVRYVTDRESHWPLLPLLWGAGLGSFQWKKWLMARWRMGKTSVDSELSGLGSWPYCMLIGAILIWGLYETNRRIVSLTSSGDLQLNYAVAQYLDRHLARDQNVLIIAEPLPNAAIEDYVETARQKGGEPGRQAAGKIVAELDTGPRDYSRTVVHSSLGKSRFFHTAQLEGDEPAQLLRSLKIRFAVLYPGVNPLAGGNQRWIEFIRQQGELQATITRGERTASIFAIQN
jgi:hypothetical protein